MPRGHVLVLDDERSILTTLQKALSLEGYTVDVAGGCKVAEEKISKTSYDIALFDVALPDGDGVTLLQKVRGAGVDIPVIMMSGHATVDAAVRATRLGAFDFLEKPVSTDRLLLVIENALRLIRAEAEAKALRTQAGLGDLLGQSRAMLTLREQIERAAKSTATVLVMGERGTGKELVARAIHVASKRAKGPLEKMSCAAIPSELFESELFGHEAGAFTGATKQRRGKFERASGGTLFLDEIGDMPLAMQAKLLRVLQERPPPPPPPIEQGRSGLTVAGLVLGGLGLCALATSAGFGIAGFVERGELDDCKPCSQGRIDDVRRTFIIGDVFLANGAALVTASIVLLVVGGNQSTADPKQARLLLLPSLSGGAVGIRTTF